MLASVEDQFLGLGIYSLNHINMWLYRVFINSWISDAYSCIHHIFFAFLYGDGHHWRWIPGYICRFIPQLISIIIHRSFLLTEFVHALFKFWCKFVSWYFHYWRVTKINHNGVHKYLYIVISYMPNLTSSFVSCKTHL